MEDACEWRADLPVRHFRGAGAPRSGLLHDLGKTMGHLKVMSSNKYDSWSKPQQSTDFVTLHQVLFM